MLSIVLTMVLISELVFFASADPLDAQQNETSNMTTSTQQGQQNQTTGIGTASEIENITGGNIPVLGNETDIQRQNDTSVTEGMQQEQVTTDTNMSSNQSGSGG
jgi:hypothetical protein